MLRGFLGFAYSVKNYQQVYNGLDQQSFRLGLN